VDYFYSAAEYRSRGILWSIFALALICWGVCCASAPQGFAPHKVGKCHPWFNEIPNAIALVISLFRINDHLWQTTLV
jgi:hypothetical protein